MPTTETQVMGNLASILGTMNQPDALAHVMGTAFALAKMDEAEVLAHVMTMVSALTGLGWAVFGLKLNISRAAALNFSLANLLLVLVDVVALFRPAGVGYFEFIQAFNVADFLILSATLLFRSGMRALYELPCTTVRDHLAMALGVLLLWALARALDWQNAACVSIYLVAGFFCLKGYAECSVVLRKSFNKTTARILLWPIAAAGILFILRALDDTRVMLHTPGNLNDTMKFKHFAHYMWAQLLVLMLVNASFVGLTLTALIKKLNDQAQRLQHILDTAPVGVAVSSGGIIRFANPRVTELLDMKVGDVATSALVEPEVRTDIVSELKSQGSVHNMEVQMFCANHTVRDLLVTYLPTDHEGAPGILGWMVDITERKKNEKKILFNRTVVENSEPMFWADPETLTVVYANKAGLALMQSSAERLVGSRVPPQFLDALSRSNMPALMAKLRNVGHPLRFETRHTRLDGSVLDVDVSYYVAEDEDRSLLVATMRDISEQKKAEKAIRQASDEQNAIFESANMGIALIKDWSIIRVNHRMAELFGWELDEMLGQSPRIWYPETRELSEGPYADILRGEIHTSTQEVRRKDGSRFWCRVSGNAIDRNDLSSGTVWMFDDVTAERKAAELMRQAKEMAEEATRMKSDFLANMSHEIRTPMNAIIGMTHLALHTELSAKQRNYIEKIDGAARNLLGIINDILDFSKIEAGKLQFENAEFHLEDVMETLADLSVIKAQDKGLELLFDVGPDVPTALVGDALRLGQVLINLVGNAIKFTQRGEVTVGIHVLESDPASPPDSIQLRFDISDTGVGLSSEQSDKLFNAFSQADASTTRRYGGTGLGLTISKRLVELMGGKISVQSQLGVGSTFTFTACFGLQKTLPRERPTLDADVRALRILIVDDNARAREIMLAMLASQNFDATAVPGGAEAIATLEAAQSAGQPYGLVLMDWMMPELDGLATIQQIRSDPRLDGVPAFVMVTAHSRDEFLDQADGTRIDGLLLKPVSPSALLDSILTALGKEVVTKGRKQQRQQASHAAEQSVRGAYLLLVEDNAVNQELALELLQAAGIRVDVANNGLEALSQVKRHDYDGVLMDCQMPVMDGFEATRRIRADSRFAQLPILAMTANAVRGDRELCLAAGMNDHIGKPIDVVQLFKTLAQWIKPKTTHMQALPDAPAPLHRRETDLPMVVGLDLAQALQRMGGNAKLVRKLIARFAQTQAGVMGRIESAITSGALETALREAHTTKGLAGNIGATRLLGLAADVESALRHGAQDALQPALVAMSDELNMLLGQIAASLHMPQTASMDASAPLPDRPDPSVLANELAQLAALLADDDARAARLSERLVDKLRSVGQGGNSLQLQKLIAKYEFEDALKLVHEIARALDVTLPLQEHT